jgi:uncharacterized protein
LELAGELHAPSARKSVPALCICHGIPAVPADPAEKGYRLLAERFCRAGFMTLIFNFRGTGESEGNLDIMGWTRDLKAALDFLHGVREVDKSRVCLLGFSGGAAVSVYVAAHDHRVYAVAACACPADFRPLYEVETTLDTIQRFREIGVIRDEAFPPSIEAWEEGFETVAPIDWIDSISPRHLLLVHGDADQLIPLGHAHRLYSKAREPKELHVVHGAGHRLRLEEEAATVVLEWLTARCLRADRQPG